MLANLQWTEGEMTWNGIRYMLIRPDTVTVFQKAVEGRLGAEANELMFAGGRAGGGGTARTLHGRGMAPREVAAAMAHMGGRLGWGAFTLERLDDTALVLRVDNSAFAAAYGQATGPACHFIRGVFAGVAELAFGGALSRAQEVECAAAGGACCRFEYRP